MSVELNLDLQAVAAQTVVDNVAIVIFVIQAVVVSIALISLLVGGIGIINVMLMSVLERTREIGIMKAVGAKRGDIVFIFLTEATVVAFVGGVLGIILGLGISSLAAFVIARFVVVNMQLIVSPLVIFGGLFIALLTGVLGGLYPALRASKMSPVDALRSE